MSILHQWLEKKIDETTVKTPELTVIDGMTVSEATKKDAVDFIDCVLTMDELNWYKRFVEEKGWSVQVESMGDRWRVVRIIAKADRGTIQLLTDGQPRGWDMVVVVDEESPLYQPDSDGYKQWIWGKMQEDADILAKLYEIANNAYVGCDVYIEGPNASGVVAAANYVLKEYAAKAGAA